MQQGRQLAVSSKTPRFRFARVQGSAHGRRASLRGVHHFQVHPGTNHAELVDVPLPADSCVAAMRATSSALPHELRFNIEVISGAAMPSSFHAAEAHTAFSPIEISVCMSASFFWINWLGRVGRPNCLRSST